MNIHQPVISGSLTVTGSSTFIGNLTIQSGSITLSSGSLSLSGSNLFGSDITNTQTFTGSVNISGSNHTIFGNVNVGLTGSSGYTLDVSGSARVNGGAATLLRIGSVTGAVPQAALVVHSETDVKAVLTRVGSTDIYLKLGTNGSWGDVWGNYGLTIRTTGTAGGTSDGRIQITPFGGTTTYFFPGSGNIGINTTTDAGYKLDVNGSSRIQSGLTVTGSLNVSQGITGSFILSTGTITAQTLVVSTISSSVEYSSGSNIFGNSTANTQTFTGSVNITGSVGINTGVPAYTLDVNGTGRFIGNVGIRTAPTSNSLEVLGTANNWAVSFTANTTTGQSYGAIVRGGTNSSDVAFAVNNAANNIGYFVVRGDGAATFSSSVTAGGTVTINSGTSDATFLANTTGLYSYLTLQKSNAVSTIGKWDVMYRGDTYFGNTTNALIFLGEHFNSSSAVDGYYMPLALQPNGNVIMAAGSNVLGNGNVGIRTTSPTVALQINGQSTFEPMVPGAATGSLAINSANGLYGLYIASRSNGDTWMQVGRNDGSATAYNLLLQVNGGYVGIGTTSPTAPLTINGSIAGGDSFISLYNSGSNHGSYIKYYANTTQQWFTGTNATGADTNYTIYSYLYGNAVLTLNSTTAAATFATSIHVAGTTTTTDLNLGATYSYSYTTTSGWQSAMVTIVPTGTLVVNATYMLQLYWTYSAGNSSPYYANASATFTTCTTNGTGTGNAISLVTSNHTPASAAYYNIATLGAGGFVCSGLAVQLMNFATAGGTLTVYVTRLA